MRLTHEGWTQEKGRFRDIYELDTTRSDYEIHWKDGTVCKQISAFEAVEADWNCDGDVYTEIGANFESKYGAGRDWYTPLELIRLVIDGEITIPGIQKI